MLELGTIRENETSIETMSVLCCDGEVIVCKELPSFDPNNLASIQAALCNAVALPFQQSWLKTTASNFAPAVVQLGYRGDSLFAFGHLVDFEVTTLAQQDNQRLWELGDTFEIFLKRADEIAYSEFQISPNNLRLQLRFADPDAAHRAAQVGSLDDVMFDRDVLRSKTWCGGGRQYWNVLAEISTDLIGEGAGALRNSDWLISFGRYDYSGGCMVPILSSTSPHLEPNFHRCAEWRRLRCSENSSSSLKQNFPTGH